MIRADFYSKNEMLNGFRLSGHAGYAESGSDIVCAAVSSAVQLTVNMLESFGCEPEASAADNVVSCEVSENLADAERIIGQLRLHLESVLEDFPKTIKITISEV